MSVSGVQHPLPKNREKFFPKFDRDDRKLANDHIKKCMLAIRLCNRIHEYVVCRLFPYTFEGRGSTTYFLMSFMDSI